MSPSCGVVSPGNHSLQIETANNNRLGGWLFYKRVKTGKTFYRPMNRVVHAHIKSILADESQSDDPIYL